MLISAVVDDEYIHIYIGKNIKIPKYKSSQTLEKHLFSQSAGVYTSKNTKFSSNDLCIHIQSNKQP